MSRFDQIYRSLILTKFFTKGWGDPDSLKKILEFRKKISHRDICKHLVSSSHPIVIDSEKEEKHYIIQEGHFKSPFIDHVPGVMPKEVETAKFQVILPKVWPGKLKPMCLHLAGTGDHYFGRRRMLLAKPLLKEAGIGSILLENPYYGYRKPKQQTRSSLQNVSDLFVMGGALVLESIALFHWCEQQGYGPLGITGISMGGHNASLAASNWHKPLTLVPCLSWSTASAVFLQGVMSGAIPWKLLHEQYTKDSKYEEEITKLIVSPEDNVKNLPYLMGQKLAKQYPHNLDGMLTQKSEQISSESGHCEKLKHRASSQPHDAHSHPRDAHSHPHDAHSHPHDAHSHPHDAHSHPLHSRHKDGSKVIQQLTVNTPNLQFHTSALLLDDQSKSSESSGRGRSGVLKKSDYWIAAVLKNSLQWNRKSKKRSKSEISESALDFMRGIMDECTHLGNFSCPIDTDLIIIIQAKQDAYVPRDNVLSLSDLWPGAEVRYVDWGHVGAFLFRQDVFRTAIIDSFRRQARKYYDSDLPTKR